ncbi:hypothetical protein ACTGZM_09350 [Streptococcus suis]
MTDFSQTILGAIILGAGGQLAADSIKYSGTKIIEFIKDKYKPKQVGLSPSQIEQVVDIIAEEKARHIDDLKRDFIYNLDMIANFEVLSYYFDDLGVFIKENIGSIQELVKYEEGSVTQSVKNNHAARDINVAGRDNIIHNSW